MTRALHADLANVAISISATTLPFASSSAGELTGAALVGTACYGLQATLVKLQFRGRKGHPPARRDANPVTVCGGVPAFTARTWLLTCQFLGSVLYIGLRGGGGGLAGPLWLAGVACYILAFAIWAPVNRTTATEPLSARVPWHRARRNGFHEDFHLMLLAADVLFLAMAVRFLEKS